MSTNRDIVTTALKLIKVVAAGETPSPEDAADALSSLRKMVSSWEGRGVYHGLQIGELGDLFPFEDKHIDGIEAMLAVRIATEYGKAVSSEVQAQAFSGWQAIQADYLPIEPLRVDSGLQWVPSQRRWDSQW